MSQYLVRKAPFSVLSGLVFAGALKAQAELPKTDAPVATTTTTTPTNAQGVYQDFTIGDGNPLSLKDLALGIIPPAGWEVITNNGNVTMVMQEPKPEFSKNVPKEGEVIFQRNITVAVMHEASPIDEERAKEFEKQLTERLGKASLVSNFQVIEHRFVDYRGKNDALLAYSSLKLGEHQMMQMHLLVSGEEKQFLLSFTDLEKRFVEDKDAMQNVWNSMMSVEIKGTAPSRYAEVIQIGGGVSVALLILGLMSYMRRKSSNRLFDEDYGDDDVSSDIKVSKKAKKSKRASADFDDEDYAVSNVSTVSSTFNDDEDMAWNFQDTKNSKKSNESNEFSSYPVSAYSVS
ncbi:MAG: hypothetical protein KBD78_15085 [Oligoflexales bacterium]|nr:hypothetical protein [Oligoflexales bacterium]